MVVDVAVDFQGMGVVAIGRRLMVVKTSVQWSAVRE